MRTIINSGLTDEQANKVLEILAQVGHLEAPAVLARTLGIRDVRRLMRFIETPRARQASKLATDLSRREYYHRLIDEGNLTETAATPTGPLGLESDLLTGNGISIKEGRELRRNSPTEDRNDSFRYFKKIGETVDPEVFDAWDKIAGKV